MIIEALLTFEHPVAVVASDPTILSAYALFITALAPASAFYVFVTVVVALIALVTVVVTFGKSDHRGDDIEMLIVEIQVDAMPIGLFVKHNLDT
jgi:hypothetical protein